MSADVLRELARAKAIFQLRAIEAVIRGPAQGIEARQGGDGTAPREAREPGGDSHAPNLKAHRGERQYGEG